MNRRTFLVASLALASLFPRQAAAQTAGPASALPNSSPVAGIPDGAYTAVASKDAFDREGVPFECPEGVTNVVVELVLDTGHYTQYQACEGSVQGFGDKGSVAVTPQGLKMITSEDGSWVLATYDLGGSTLTLHLVATSEPSDPSATGSWSAIGRLLYDHAFQRKTVAEAGPTTTPSLVASPVAGIPEGRYVAAPVAVADIEAAIAARGFDPHAWDPGLATMETNALELGDGQFHVWSANDDAPLAQTWAGHYSISGPGTLTLGDGQATTTLHYTNSADGLTIDRVSASSPDDDAAAVAIFASAPFHACGDLRLPDCRAAVAGLRPTTPPSASPVAGIPDGTYTATATKADATKTGWTVDQCAMAFDGAHLKLVLDRGHWTLSESCAGTPETVGDQGTYTSTGDRLVKTAACCPGTETLSRSADGDLLTLYILAIDEANTQEKPERFCYDHDWRRVP